MSGFSTHGYRAASAASSGSPESAWQRKRGTGTPAAASAVRMASLSAARHAAAGGLAGRPRRLAASAAMTAVASLPGTMPPMGRCRAASAICSAARSGRR